MSEIQNLWPEKLFEKLDVLLPVAVLQQQAKYFNDSTKNIIVASVETSTVSIVQNKNINETKPGIIHALKITAPAIGNYTFELVRLIQGQALPYPIKVVSPLTDQKFEALDSKELENVLSMIFNSREIIATIQSLMLQSTSL